MMQNAPPLTTVPRDEDVDPNDLTLRLEIPTPEQTATIWANRITGVTSAVSLFVALAVWAGRHSEHFRLVLLLLVIAMFSAILHAYTFENGQQP